MDARQPTEVTLRAVVTRADGRVEDLGVVGYYHRNPLRRAWFVLCRRVRRLARRG